MNIAKDDIPLSFNISYSTLFSFIDVLDVIHNWDVVSIFYLDLTYPFYHMECEWVIYKAKYGYI